jgi:Transcriptional Coactivator p15 (PC4)
VVRTNKKAEKMSKQKKMMQAFTLCTVPADREWYDKDGEEAPGKKGLSLTGKQWTTLLDAIPAINEAVGRLAPADPAKGAGTGCMLVSNPLLCSSQVPGVGQIPCGLRQTPYVH